MTINVDVPLSVKTGTSYNPESARAKYLQNARLIAQNYKYEKFIGERKHNGDLKLKELRPEHKQYVTAWLQGMKGVEIADHFNVSALTVYRVLSDPLIKPLIEEFDEGFKEEFKRLFPLATDAIRDGLNDSDLDIRLKATDRFVKMSRLIEGTGEENTDGRVKAVFAARTKFVQMIKDVSGVQVIETETEVRVTV